MELIQPLADVFFWSQDVLEGLFQTYIVDNWSVVDIAKTKYMFVLTVFNFALALAWRLLPNIPAVKHIFSIIVGLWLCSFIDKMSVILSFGSSLLVYVIMIVFPTSIGRFLGSGFALVLSTYGHIYRMENSWMKFTLDWTLIQMLLTQKLTMYCFDIHDGKIPIEEIHHPHAKHHRLDKRPSLLEFFGYVYFFPPLLVGPMHPMQKYLEFTSMAQFKDVGGRIPTSAIFQGIGRSLIGCLWIPLYLVGLYFPLNYVLNPEFAQYPLYFKLIYQIAASYMFKPLYYYAWLSSEGALVVMGYGFHGVEKDGSYKWDRASNVYITDMELAENLVQMTLKWNVATQRWLKYYVYTRLIAAGYPRLANPVTFMISAFWHGFYPGYYFLFVFGPVLTLVTSLQKRKINPLFQTADGKPGKYWRLYNWFCILVCQLSIMYLLGSMTTLNWADTIGMFNSVYWSGHILIVIWLGVLLVLPKPASTKKKDGTRPPSTKKED